MSLLSILLLNELLHPFHLTYNLSAVLFITFSIINSFSNQFGVQPFAKIFLYFDILTISSILNYLISLQKSIYVLDFTSTGFILIGL